ncbi:MAG: hypothetical protein ACXW3K_02660 [Brevundimonas sp.]
MTYFVYIETDTLSVPYMEPLDADCPTAATVEALKCLRTHTHGTAAHVYEGDTCVASVRREEMGH